MNKLIIIIVLVISVAACQPQGKIDTSIDTELSTQLDTVSYLLGYNYAKDLKTNTGLTELDRTSFLTAMQRIFEDKESEISDDVANQFMNAFIEKLTLNKLESQINQDPTNEDLKQQLAGLKAKMIAEEKAKMIAEEEAKKLEQINKFVGWTFDLDYYHRIKFESETTYRIWQKQLTCGGRGSWSFQNGKIIFYIYKFV